MSVETTAFNLSAPPGFRGLHPDIQVEIYHRKMPHWRQSGATYFVTFRLADSIPQDKLQQLKEHRRRWEQTHPEPRSEQLWHAYAREISAKTERWLDEGYGECHFRQAVHARLLAGALRNYQDTKCRTSCLVVMPNHAHAVMKPYGDFKLEAILQVVKGYVSHEVGHGSIWEPESYDRIIRDEEHLYRVIQYIGRNGSRAGLPADEFLRWLHPEWIDAGWQFNDQQSHPNQTNARSE
jgi:REP element-mobilizing transposase RayT